MASEKTMFRKIVIVKHEQTAPMHIVNHIRQFLRPEEIVATIRVSKEWKDTVTDVRVEKLSFTRRNKREELKMLSLFHNHLKEICLTQSAPSHICVLKVDFPNLIKLRLNFAEQPKVTMEKIAVHLLNQPSLRDVTLDIENINWLGFTTEVPWESLKIDGGKLPLLYDKLPNLRTLDIATDDTESMIDFRRYPKLQRLTLYYQEVFFSHKEECKLEELAIAATNQDTIPDISTLPSIPSVKIMTYIDHGMLGMWNDIVQNKNFREVRITHDDEDPDFPFFLLRSHDAIIFSVGPAHSDYPEKDLADFVKKELGPWLRDISNLLKLPIKMSRRDMSFKQRYKLLGYLLSLNIFTDTQLETMMYSQVKPPQRRFSIL